MGPECKRIYRAKISRWNFDPSLVDFGRSLVVTVVPRRPKRPPRIEKFLDRLKHYRADNPFWGSTSITYEPQLLAFRNGVRSQHKDRLKKSARFENVREHLYVNEARKVDQKKSVLVIDDVCTTGASLICAGECPKKAGSGEATRLAIAVNIGNVLYD